VFLALPRANNAFIPFPGLQWLPLAPHHLYFTAYAGVFLMSPGPGCVCGYIHTALQNHLIAPCRCKGTQAWVHRGCLSAWLVGTPPLSSRELRAHPAFLQIAGARCGKTAPSRSARSASSPTSTSFCRCSVQSMACARAPPSVTAHHTLPAGCPGRVGSAGGSGLVVHGRPSHGQAVSPLVPLPSELTRPVTPGAACSRSICVRLLKCVGCLGLIRRACAKGAVDSSSSSTSRATSWWPS
jgi:hypothetical protein